MYLNVTGSPILAIIFTVITWVIIFGLCGFFGKKKYDKMIEEKAAAAA